MAASRCPLPGTAVCCVRRTQNCVFFSRLRTEALGVRRLRGHFLNHFGDRLPQRCFMISIFNIAETASWFRKLRSLSGRCRLPHLLERALFFSPPHCTALTLSSCVYCCGRGPRAGPTARITRNCVSSDRISSLGPGLTVGSRGHLPPERPRQPTASTLFLSILSIAETASCLRSVSLASLN